MTETEENEVPHGPVWWTALGVGTLLMAYGAYGLLGVLLPEQRPRWLLWFVGGLAVHDFVLVPAVLAVGLLVRRAFPSGVRGPVQAGLLASAVLVLVSVPVLTGYGRASQQGNPSLLPFDYVPNLLGVLALVWAVTAVVAVAAVLRARRARAR